MLGDQRKEQASRAQSGLVPGYPAWARSPKERLLFISTVMAVHTFSWGSGLLATSTGLWISMGHGRELAIWVKKTLAPAREALWISHIPSLLLAQAGLAQ